MKASRNQVLRAVVSILSLGFMQLGSARATNQVVAPASSAQWISHGTPGKAVQVLAIDPTDPSTIYAGRNRRGVSETTDGGATWRSRKVGGDATGIAVDPTDPATIYLATDDRAVYKSIDGGKTWQHASTGIGTIFVISLAMDPSNPAVLYAGTSRQGVYKTTDGAATWTQASSGLPAGEYVWSLSIDPSRPKTIYAGTAHGVYWTTTGGTSWARVSNGLPAGIVYRVALAPSDPSRIYAAFHGAGVYASTDAGAKWQEANTGLGDLNVAALAVDPTTGTTVYAGTFAGAGVYRSTDGGVTWKARDNGLTQRSGRALAIDPSSPKTIWVGTLAGSVFRSTDRGDSWEPRDEGLSTASVWAVAVDPTNRQIIYAGSVSGQAGLYKSTDGGSTWRQLKAPPSPPDAYVAAITIDSLSPLTVYASVGSTLMKSTDGGSTWRQLNPPELFSSVQSIAIDPTHPQTIYVGDDLAGMFKSTDGGKTWKAQNQGLPSAHYILAVAVDPSAPQIVYAGLYGDNDNFYGGIYRSTDGGATWTGPLENIRGEVRQVAVDATGVVYDTFGGGFNGAFCASTDHGDSWTCAPYESPAASSFVLDPSNPQLVYIGTLDRGVYVTTDRGQTWTPVGNGLPGGVPVISMAIDATGTFLHAGTYGRGEYEFQVP